MPRAVVWYGVYCVLQAVLNLVWFGLAVWLVVKNKEVANEYFPAGFFLAGGLFLMPTTLFVGVGNVWLMFRPRTKKAWSMHMGNLAVGAGTCVLTPLALPLLFAWFRPAVREWYGS
ncbi:MAG: hypothetical protein JST30_16695 [Armatimonadetes bacterium]|nr:hypothetical protein [Armatimonadota bacterium]